jgi:putative transposase
MTDTARVSRDRQRPEDRSALVGAELADQLLAKAEAQGVELLGPDGLLSQVTKTVLERALADD